MPTVWTIGYEGRTPEELARLLSKAGIQRVVDVRRLPLSRKKGFSKKGLAATLEAHGIAYTHKPELGVEKDARDAYRATGDLAALAGWYERRLLHVPGALAGLLQMVEQEQVCLLCYEEDHERCHRGLLAKRLATAGVVSMHL